MVRTGRVLFAGATRAIITIYYCHIPLLTYVMTCSICYGIFPYFRNIPLLEYYNYWHLLFVETCWIGGDKSFNFMKIMLNLKKLEELSRNGMLNYCNTTLLTCSITGMFHYWHTWNTSLLKYLNIWDSITGTLNILKHFITRMAS